MEYGKLHEYRSFKKELNGTDRSDLELMNDYKHLTEEIERKMYSYHHDNKDTAEQQIAEYEKNLETKPKKMEIEETQELHQTVHMPPFCKIVEVQKESPAFHAGLEVGDLVISYGPVNYINHNELKHIVEVTRKMIDDFIHVVVLRSENYHELKVNPRKWDGPGYLGCRFVEK